MPPIVVLTEDLDPMLVWKYAMHLDRSSAWYQTTRANICHFQFSRSLWNDSFPWRLFWRGAGEAWSTQVKLIQRRWSASRFFIYNLAIGITTISKPIHFAAFSSGDREKTARWLRFDKCIWICTTSFKCSIPCQRLSIYLSAAPMWQNCSVFHVHECIGLQTAESNSGAGKVHKYCSCRSVYSFGFEWMAHSVADPRASKMCSSHHFL